MSKPSLMKAFKKVHLETIRLQRAEVDEVWHKQAEAHERACHEFMIKWGENLRRVLRDADALTRAKVSDWTPGLVALHNSLTNGPTP